MTRFRPKLQLLVSEDAIRSKRIVLALLSFVWGIYLISPFAPLGTFSFSYFSGGLVFISYAIAVVLDVLYFDTLQVGEALYGFVIWHIAFVYHLTYEPNDDSLFFIFVALLIAWWLLIYACSTLPKRK